MIEFYHFAEMQSVFRAVERTTNVDWYD